MTASINPELNFTLDDGVQEVLGLLSGLDLTYLPEQDRYRAITRALNRALRSNALEHEWSYYSGTYSLGPAVEGEAAMHLGNTLRPRIVGDDAVRLVDEFDVVRQWAYFLPRDALHKYAGRVEGLWCSITRTSLLFSRAFYPGEAGLDVQIPVMREPTMFRLPETGVEVPALEAQYKDLMYQIIERDDRMTDSPYSNDFFVPIMGSLTGDSMAHPHPHSDGRRF